MYAAKANGKARSAVFDPSMRIRARSRLEMEAEYYAQQGGRDSELAKRSRDMAKDMWATAEEAERQARDYQSQLPHGRVY